MTDRTVILHYHLFKNAGTSMDSVLKANFPDRWVTREFAGQNNTGHVTEWIRDTPDAVAFSSHTMMGPLPQIPGVNIISVMLLRDPISRILSAYQFERQQDSDNFGAVLARHTDLNGYIRVRLALPHDRQCRNFQTWRLASLQPGPESEAERARAGLDQLSVVGLVRQFDATVALLKSQIRDVYPEFRAESQHANRSGTKEKLVLSPADDAHLRQMNADDLSLLTHAQNGMLSAMAATLEG